MNERALRQPLAGRRIWLTRPLHQSHEWARDLEAAGAQVDVEPLLDIIGPPDEAAANRTLEAAEQADVVVATSSNAVRGAWRLRPHFAPSGVLCAVGAATGQALEQATGRQVQYPQQGDTSEALLALPALSNVAGSRIVLLSGEGGRGKLVEALSARGGHVGKAALYRRRPAAIEPQRLQALVDSNDTVVVTSGEAMQHLGTLVHSCENDAVFNALARLTVVVPSRRVVQITPEDLFAHPPRVVERMTVEAVVTALEHGQQGAGQ